MGDRESDLGGAEDAKNMAIKAVAARVANSVARM